MKTETLADPTPAEARDFYADWRRDGVVCFYCDCEVEYDGRASGYLGPGERVVVCKPDGTLLVHRPSGRDPVNWQPPGGTIRVRVADADPVVEARRSDPAERVRVRCRALRLVVAYAAVDDAPLELSGTESDMHEYIVENPASVEEGLRVIEHERSTPYGNIDVYAVDEDGRPVVVEVKRRRATHTHVDQLRRYMARYREENPEARGVLVAPAATSDVKRGLREAGLEFVALDVFVESAADTTNAQLTDFS